ncbi:MAG: hypothetical protein O3A46_04810, partial [Candidatus Poribacteria bacterium]|nr:hypothetical protein [Candidatus Poribacteria bacterium]
ARQVVDLVEGFLRDAVITRNVQAYLSVLDDEFQYTFDNGTPTNLDDDRIFNAEEYEQVAVSQLFDRNNRANVALSPPRRFEQLQPDVASISYDYDMNLIGSSNNNRRMSGTASFLLVRGGTSGDSVSWRILEWVDSPPDPQRWSVTPRN